MTQRGRSLFVLVLALAAGAEPASADRWACSVITAGDTAAQVAVDLTGLAENRHRAWFQIADPAARRFVPKAGYDDIRPGWLACILQPSLSAASGAPRVARAGLWSGTLPALTQIADTFAAVPIELGGLVLLFAAALLIWYFVDQYWTDRHATIARMTQLGQAFIREFERPLVQPRAAERAVHSRLRLQPDRARIEVLLAPAAGRRYPNLTDHRQNVEYDIARVLAALEGQSRVAGPLHQQGPWVVIPLECTSPPRQEGVT